MDITQALGRVVLDCGDADILISSTHIWSLGIHGGGIIGVPAASSPRLTTHAGGWFHLQNAFDADRFGTSGSEAGAASFSVGMPNFVALYALNASLRYLEGIGVAKIAAHGIRWSRWWKWIAGVWRGADVPENGSGILAFQHPRSVEIHAALERENVHVMHHAGRIRVAIHGLPQYAGRYR